MHKVDYYEIGQKIKSCRIEQGLSQEKAAELCGISASFYGNIERGARKMSLETFVDICSALHLSPDYVLSEELPDSDPVILNLLSEVKKSGSVQYNRYLYIIKTLAKISDKL